MLVFAAANYAIYVYRNSIIHGEKGLRKFCLSYVYEF